MTPERLHQIEELFHSALALEPSRRADFLGQVCEGDEALRREVASLLRSHDVGESFIEQPAADVAAEVLAGGQARLEAGQTINHYRIISPVGGGRGGAVFFAQKPKTDPSLAPINFNHKINHDATQPTSL